MTYSAVAAVGALLPNPTADQIMDAHFSLVSSADGVQTADFTGVSGWTCDDPHPVLSLFRWNTENADAAAKGLDEVIECFSSKKRGFDWLTSPGQSSLLPLLEDRGFVGPAINVAAMARPIFGDESASTLKDADIVRTEEKSDQALCSVMAEGFEVPDEVGRRYHNAYCLTSDLQRTDVYKAVDRASGATVGVGYLSYIGNGPVVLMRVSTVMPAYRRLGIYQELVQRRLVDAAKAGRKVAMVHAYSDESKRALERLGFETAGILKLHRWRP